MPVSPDYAAGLAKAMADLFGDAEERLLALIARRLAKGLAEPSWADRQLLAVQDVLGQARGLADVLATHSEATLSDVIRTAFNRGAALAGTDLTEAGVARGLAFGGINLSAVRALVDQSKTSLVPTGLRIQSSAGQIFRSVVQQVAGQMLTGADTRRTAAVSALQQFARQGITGFQDTAGRSWSMVSYAEMVTRTAASQAIVQGHVDQLSDAGFDLVMISDAPEECIKCRPWEGAILSTKGYTPKGVMTRNGHSFVVAGTLREATAAGLFHPNCRHRTTVFLPGITKRLRDTADPEGDALRQKQRLYERQLRALKRQIAVAQELDPKGPGTVQLKGKLRAKSADFGQFIADNDRKRLRYRESANYGTK